MAFRDYVIYFLNNSACGSHKFKKLESFQTLDSNLIDFIKIII